MSKQNLGRKQFVNNKRIEQKIDQTFKFDFNHRCCKCGKIYNEQKKYFPISYSNLYIGNDGYLSICNDCINKLYNELYQRYNNEYLVYKYICMSFNIYYDKNVAEISIQNSKPQEKMSYYINKLASNKCSNKSYFDTIDEEKIEDNKINSVNDVINKNNDITQDDVKKWGFGFEESDYVFLNEKYNSWINRHECNTMAQEEIFKKLSLMDLQIIKSSQNGEKYTDLLKQYNDFLTSANIKPNQQNDTILNNNVPYGMLIKKIEYEKPIGKSEYEDVDKILYCYKWFLGHLLKIFDKKNKYRDEYEEILKEFTIKPPIYDENHDIDEIAYNDIFGDESF